jgi:hypothetical protein
LDGQKKVFAPWPIPISRASLRGIDRRVYTASAASRQSRYPCYYWSKGLLVCRTGTIIDAQREIRFPAKLISGRFNAIELLQQQIRGLKLTLTVFGRGLDSF